MDLDRYVADLRAQLAAVAETGDTDVQTVAERLSVALDAAARLVLLEALSDAASEITREIAPASVDVRLRGRDPEFLVTRPEASGFSEPATMPADPQGAGEPGPLDDPADDTVTARTTLRLPDRLKARVERAAAEDRVSVNSWMVRAIAAALEPKSRRAAQRETRTGDSFIGWVR